ncbi:hypothetical protein [Mycobacterium riyadhense]|nr:hypothetical protein [Mycobacterium riyadhense]
MSGECVQLEAVAVLAVGAPLTVLAAWLGEAAGAAGLPLPRA